MKDIHIMYGKYMIPKQNILLRISMEKLIEQFDPNPQPGTTISKASLEPARKGLGLQR